MTNQKRSQINKIAEQIRDAVKYTPGTDLQDIIYKLNGEICFTENLHVENNPVDAKIEKNNNSFKISININQHNNRNNFSIAHELGHLFLHMGYLINPKLWNESTTYSDSVYFRYGYSEEEYEANEFAAAFLMPESEFKEYIDANKEEHSVDIEKVANYFNVSIQAAETRGKWLRLFSWA